MKLQQYVNKVQEWIDQGRLQLPQGAHALIKEEEGSFYVSVVHTKNTYDPFAKAASLDVRR